MSISVKRHELWCTVRDMRLSKCSIIIIIIVVVYYISSSILLHVCIVKYIMLHMYIHVGLFIGIIGLFVLLYTLMYMCIKFFSVKKFCYVCR